MFTNVIGQNLSDHRWKDRILFIQASDELSDKYREQLKEFNYLDKALKERKLVVYEIVGDKYKITNFQNNKSNKSGKAANDIFGDVLNKRDDFSVTLIGLDGGIKLEKTTVLKKRELFDTIDSMPMRINELRNKREWRPEFNNSLIR